MLEQKKLPLARAYFLKAAAMYEEAVGPSHFRRCNLLEWTGETYQEEGDFATSLQYIDQALQGIYYQYLPSPDHALPNGIVAGGEEVAAACLQAKAVSLEALAPASNNPATWYKAALAHYRSSIDLLDTIRLDMAGLESRGYLIWRSKPSLEGALRISQKLQAETGSDEYAEIALEMMEKLKSNAHMNALASEKVLQNLSGHDRYWIEEDRRLSQEIQNFNRQLSGFQQPKDSTPREIQNEVRARFLAATSQRRMVRDSIRQMIPQFYNLKYDVETIRLKEIQARLGADEVLVEYSSTDSSYWAMAITPTGSVCRNLGRRGPIDSLLSQFRSVFVSQTMGESQNRTQWIQQSHALHQILVGPFADLMKPEQTLLFSPDGNLVHIPFELLLASVPPPQSSTAWRNLDFLLRHHPIAYVNSASIHFGFNDLQREAPTGGVLAMAPIFAGTSRENRNQLNALKFTEQEVKGIAQIFPTQISLGADATEAYFRQHAPHFRVLHLATHGIADLSNPHDSHILLSQDPSFPEDGALYLSELMNMRLSADMVVLSACNTGRGKLLEGEGAVSLARAFQYAGCPSVVMSLWEVDDLATAKVMELFYEYLAQGHTKPQALRLAKLNYLDSARPERTHPWFWAGFIQNGNTAPLSGLEGSGIWLWLILGGLALWVFIWAWEKDWL
jgi:CHAT domain-containing protein/tetratricopeptide (TPR) repeat protein